MSPLLLAYISIIKLVTTGNIVMEFLEHILKYSMLTNVYIQCLLILKTLRLWEHYANPFRNQEGTSLRK